jgi:hypothetical protein
LGGGVIVGIAALFGLGRLVTDRTRAGRVQPPRHGSAIDYVQHALSAVIQYLRRRDGKE